MEILETLLTALIVVVAILTLYLSSMVMYHTFRSDYFEKQQKWMICGVAWFLPVIGPAIILTVLNQDKPLVKKPGVPLLDFIFLTAVISQNSHAESRGHDVSSHDIDAGFGGGDTGVSGGD